jgi:hypothetical protein
MELCVGELYKLSSVIAERPQERAGVFYFTIKVIEVDHGADTVKFDLVGVSPDTKDTQKEAICLTRAWLGGISEDVINGGIWHLSDLFTRESAFCYLLNGGVAEAT